MKRATKSISLLRQRDSEKGAIALEMALVLPLFAVLLLGTFEFGRMAMDHQILQNAAREGARFSALSTQHMTGGSNDSAILLAIRNRVIAYLANDGITVAATDIVVDQNYQITTFAPLTVYGSNVTVTYTRPVLFNGSATFFGLGPVVLKGNAVFQNFY